jgi:hypothetical protein
MVRGEGYGLKSGKPITMICCFRDSQPLQHLLVVFLFGNVMNAQTGECLIVFCRIVLEQPYFRRPTLSMDFCRLHRAEG